MKGVHHELQNRGDLFDVPPTAMDENIGRRVRFTNPKYPAYYADFTIQAVQRNWRGDLVYRVVSDEDEHGFGCCAATDEIHFIDGEEV
jgi:hypothetical protein